MIQRIISSHRQVLRYIFFLILEILGVKVARDALMCCPQKIEMPGGKVVYMEKSSIISIARVLL